MAKLELRIYVIGFEEFDRICEEKGLHDITDLSDVDLIATAEELGTAYTFSRFLGLDVIAFDKDEVRAFFIDTENENTPPIPADRYHTIITASKVTCDRPFADTLKEVTLFEENPSNTSFVENEIKSKTYIILVRHLNNDNTNSEVAELVRNFDGVEDVEVIRQERGSIRLRVETEPAFDYDLLEDTIDGYGGLDCEFIDRTDNC